MNCWGVILSLVICTASVQAWSQQSNPPGPLPGPTSGAANTGWTVYMAKHDDVGGNHCAAFLVPTGEQPAGLGTTKTFGPYLNAGEAETSLKSSGWKLRTRFASGGSWWMASSGC